MADALLTRLSHALRDAERCERYNVNCPGLRNCDDCRANARDALLRVLAEATDVEVMGTAIERAAQECADCGYPVPDDNAMSKILRAAAPLLTARLQHLVYGLTMTLGEMEAERETLRAEHARLRQAVRYEADVAEQAIAKIKTLQEELNMERGAARSARLDAMEWQLRAERAEAERDQAYVTLCAKEDEIARRREDTEEMADHIVKLGEVIERLRAEANGSAARLAGAEADRDALANAEIAAANAAAAQYPDEVKACGHLGLFVTYRKWAELEGTLRAKEDQIEGLRAALGAECALRARYYRERDRLAAALGATQAEGGR